MRGFIVFLLLMLSVSPVYALNCSSYYNDISPFESLDFICDDVKSDSCYTIIYQENRVGGLINARPYTTFGGSDTLLISDVVSENYINGYETVNNVSIVSFSTKSIKPDYNYTFEIRCGTEFYSFNSSVSWAEPTALVRGLLYIKNNAYILLLSLLMLALLISFGIWLYNKVVFGR